MIRSPEYPTHGGVFKGFTVRGLIFVTILTLKCIEKEQKKKKKSIEKELLAFLIIFLKLQLW